jgi:hypothetical protein
MVLMLVPPRRRGLLLKRKTFVFCQRLPLIAHCRGMFTRGNGYGCDAPMDPRSSQVIRWNQGCRRYFRECQSTNSNAKSATMFLNTCPSVLATEIQPAAPLAGTKRLRLCCPHLAQQFPRITEKAAGRSYPPALPKAVSRERDRRSRALLCSQPHCLGRTESVFNGYSHGSEPAENLEKEG